MSFSNDVKTGMTPFAKRMSEVIDFVKEYFKNPVNGIKNLPDWDWPTLLVFQACASAICGSAAGIIARKLSMLLAGLFLFPITTVIISLIVTGFFYYTFVFFFRREILVRKLYTIVTLASLPFLALHTLSGLVPPINILGLFVTGILLVVGLTENTQLDRRKILKLVGAIYIVYILFWIVSMISSTRETEKIKDLATPESLETLKKEFEK